MNSPYRLEIRTPEGIEFSIDLAGPVPRFGAWIVDLLCVLAVAQLAQNTLEAFGRDIGPALAMVTFFGAQVAYGMTLEYFWKGRTIGKRLFGLRVMDVRGLRLHFSQVAMRNLLRAVDSLPFLYMVGGLCVVFSKRAQRLGDLAANTVVVRAARWAEPDLSRLESSLHNSLRERPHLEARLRQASAPQEAAICLRALQRRDQFSPEARIEVFREIATRFKTKVELPPEVTEGISDERLTANIAEALFRKTGV